MLVPAEAGNQAKNLEARSFAPLRMTVVFLDIKRRKP